MLLGNNPQNTFSNNNIRFTKHKQIRREIVQKLKKVKMENLISTSNFHNTVNLDNRKKTKVQELREMEIERDNMHLLDHLAQIMIKKPKLYSPPRQMFLSHQSKSLKLFHNKKKQSPSHLQIFKQQNTSKKKNVTITNITSRSHLYLEPFKNDKNLECTKKQITSPIIHHRHMIDPKRVVTVKNHLARTHKSQPKSQTQYQQYFTNTAATTLPITIRKFIQIEDSLLFIFLTLTKTKLIIKAYEQQNSKPKLLTLNRNKSFQEYLRVECQGQIENILSKLTLDKQKKYLLLRNDISTSLPPKGIHNKWQISDSILIQQESEETSKDVIPLTKENENMLPLLTSPSQNHIPQQHHKDPQKTICLTLLN